MSEHPHLPDRFPVIAVLGPTATGKTSVSIRLAQRLVGEVINLDSVQIYRGLDIGSAKPSTQERQGVVHHLIDIREPWDVMDAASFVRLAARAMELVISRGKVPILVGGTGFYLRSLEKGLSILPGTSPAIRDHVRKMVKEYGHEEVHKLLSSLDPQRAKAIHPRDTYRLSRALEVFLSSSMSFDKLVKEYDKRLFAPFEGRTMLKIGLMMERERLYKRIDDRVDQMISQGFIDEVSGLLAKGLSPELKPLQSIGYRHIISYLQKEKEFSQAILEMKRDTRRYAKRQLTWFRKEPGIRWFHPEKLLKAKDIWKAIN